MVQTTYKFQPGTTLKHVKTGSEYVVMLTPDQLRLESTSEPAYAYTALAEHEGPMWVRGQAEMEDGRFVEVEDEGTPFIDLLKH